MADAHSVAEKMRLSEPTTKIWMKIDPYCQRQKCRPMTLDSGGIRLMRIFADIPRRGGVKRQWGCRQRQFLAFSLVFLRSTAYAVSAHMLSQFRPSVCPSVRPSHGWISQKRLKLGSYNFHHTVAPSL